MIMRDITKEELDVILENHKHWVNEDIEGWESMCADLSGTNLEDVNMSGAYLYGAKLRGAHLRYANLENADLSEANLRYADLSHADLGGASLSNADLNDAYLNGTKNIPYIPMTCPDTGSFVGWKSCKDKVLVKLLIPEDAKRSSATGRKCRCDKAIVLDIEGADIAYSIYDDNFVYHKGETITVENFDDNRFVECGAGIHFFINKEEAMNY